MYKDSRGHIISIEPNPIGQGGEGRIYRVTGKYTGLLLKVFTKRDYGLKKAAKIGHMIQYSPLKYASAQLKQTIIWPVESAYKNGDFVGFLMPEVQGGIDLSWLLKTKIPFHKIGMEFQKFDWHNSDSWYYRLSICYNLARALEYVHKSGQFTVLDLKPENLMISSKGIISFIDTDSFQITDRGKLLFPAEAYTAAYSPKERLRLDPKKDMIAAEWSYFSFAIIAYLILIGEHPFNGVIGVNNTDPADHIVKGYYVHRRKYAHNLHRRHVPFLKLPTPIQTLFHRCFAKGLKRPTARPDFAEWYQALDKAIETLYPVPGVLLAAKPSVVLPKQKVTFSWAVFDAHAVEIEGLGKVKPIDEFSVRPEQSLEITLRASSGSRAVEKRARVEVVQKPRVIFQATPRVIKPGKSSKLSWSLEPPVRIRKTYLNGERVYFFQSKRVRPIEDTNYQLDLHWKGGVIRKQLQVQTLATA